MLRASPHRKGSEHGDLREVPNQKAPSVYYEDDAVRLYHGSCIDVLPQLESVDHVISDPPYARDVYIRALGNNTKKGSKTPDRLYKGAGLARLAAGDIGHIDDLLSPVALEIARLTRRWAIVFSDAETTWRWRHELEGAGLRYIRTGAWVKPDAMPQMTGDRPGVGFEPCTICHAQGPMRWNGGGTPATWQHFTAKGDSRPEGHPCPKPLPLMVELVNDFTDEGETILDPFAGSGQTGKAAKLNGRKAILIEVNERYCEIAANEMRRTEPGRLFDRVAKAKPQSLLPPLPPAPPAAEGEVSHVQACDCAECVEWRDEMEMAE